LVNVTRLEVLGVNDSSNCLVSNSLSEVIVFENFNEELTCLLDHRWGCHGIDNNTSIRLLTDTVKVVATFEKETWAWIVVEVQYEIILAQLISNGWFEETLSSDTNRVVNEVVWEIKFDETTEFHGNRDS
jgi:hypothetical protein